jgi:hypothetical protein
LVIRSLSLHANPIHGHRQASAPTPATAASGDSGGGGEGRSTVWSRLRAQRSVKERDELESQLRLQRELREIQGQQPQQPRS